MLDEYVVTITAEDIAQAEPRCSFRCPVAVALRRATGKAWQVTPDYFHMGGLGHVIAPVWLSRRITRLDHDGDMEPFSFRLKRNPGTTQFFVGDGSEELAA